MALTVALLNMKGGVGKSTLAVNLAYEIATGPWHKNVLVVDLDPQFNSSQYLLGDEYLKEIIEGEPPTTVWDIFEQNTTVPGRSASPIDPNDVIFPVGNTSISKGSLDLIPSRFELSKSLQHPAGKEHLLQRALKQLEDSYDLVVIDCSPTESMLTTATYIAADYLLIPVQPEYLSAIGLPLLERSLHDFCQICSDINPPDVLGIVFNMAADYSPEEMNSKPQVRREAEEKEWYVFDAEIRYSKSFPRSAREGKPIWATPHVREGTTSIFHDFAKEFVERAGL